MLRSPIMTSRSNANPTGTPTDDFESALETLILESFAEGTVIEGAWEVTPPSSVVPNWRITIEKTDNADTPHDESMFLDE